MSRCRVFKTVFNASGVPEKVKCVKSRGHIGGHDFGSENKWQRALQKLMKLIKKRWSIVSCAPPLRVHWANLGLAQNPRRMTRCNLSVFFAHNLGLPCPERFVSGQRCYARIGMLDTNTRSSGFGTPAVLRASTNERFGPSCVRFRPPSLLTHAGILSRKCPLPDVECGEPSAESLQSAESLRATSGKSPATPSIQSRTSGTPRPAFNSARLGRPAMPTSTLPSERGVFVHIRVRQAPAAPASR